MENQLNELVASSVSISSGKIKRELSQQIYHGDHYLGKSWAVLNLLRFCSFLLTAGTIKLDWS